MQAQTQAQEQTQEQAQEQEQEQTQEQEQEQEQPTEPKKPRNWLDILLKIGLGVCIFALLVMIFKLIGGSTPSLFYEEEKKDKPSDDFTIFPGLFDDPLTLFERGDNNQIKKIDEEIELLEKQILDINDKGLINVCQDHNLKFNDLPTDTDEYIKGYNNIIQECQNDGCNINSSEVMGECVSLNDRNEENDKECLDNYVNQYRSSNTDIHNGCSEKNTTLPCSFNPPDISDYLSGSNIDLDKLMANGYFSGAGDKASEYFSGAGDKASEYFSGAGDKASEYFSGGGEYFSGAGDKASEYFSGAGEYFSDKYNNNVEGMISDMKNICVSLDLNEINEKISELKGQKRELTSYKIQFG